MPAEISGSARRTLKARRKAPMETFEEGRGALILCYFQRSGSLCSLLSFGTALCERYGRVEYIGDVFG